MGKILARWRAQISEQLGRVRDGYRDTVLFFSAKRPRNILPQIRKALQWAPWLFCPPALVALWSYSSEVKDFKEWSEIVLSKHPHPLENEQGELKELAEWVKNAGDLELTFFLLNPEMLKLARKALSIERARSATLEGSDL
ncbi:MAG: hypothetical protein KGI80_05095 [Verrucomicrobiota bacterium]|nr:hypothetical protein [Verrucomicrobiota bacterium]